jgi:hypothetical protein
VTPSKYTSRGLPADGAGAAGVVCVVADQPSTTALPREIPEAPDRLREPLRKEKMFRAVRRG